MPDFGTKDELDDDINQLLFGSEGVVDFSKMRRDDLILLKRSLNSDQGLLVAKRLAEQNGVGQGKVIEMLFGESAAEQIMSNIDADSITDMVFGGGSDDKDDQT